MIPKSKNNHRIQNLQDTCVHDWYRFVLAYPDHLVSDVIDRFGAKAGDIVLDPFVGTGTTLVECKRRGIHSIGVDANPVAAFASRVKTRWDIDLEEFDRRCGILLRRLNEIFVGLIHTVPANTGQLSLDSLLSHPPLPENIDEFEKERILKLIPKDAMSEIPLQKTLLAKQVIDTFPDDAITDLFRLTLVYIAVREMSNLGFGPEVYVKRKKRVDGNLIAAFTKHLRKSRDDLWAMQQIPGHGSTVVYCADARELSSLIDTPVNFVITSPPYPNEKDYTRITRLEMALLEFVHGRSDLRQIKNTMLRSNTRNIYKGDSDKIYVEDIPEITTLAEEIEQKRIERGGTSGFERLYHRVVGEYFGGMYRVLEQLQQVLLPGGKVAMVVGDQESYFRVPIPTAKLLGAIASRKLDYIEVETLVWRTRKATATRRDIEEHILILQRC